MSGPRVLTHWIDGKPSSGAAKRSGDVFDPATGSVAAQVPLATPADVDAAVAAALGAFAEWRTTPLGRRARVLFAFRELAERHKDDLARIVSSEHGKVLADALGEVARGLEVVEFACGIPHLLKGGYSEEVSTDTDVHSIRQPLGVCAGITPFNFPVMVPMWMWPVAVACGNTFVLKPSERDPSASMLVAEWLADAGLPAGVFNVVHGDKDAVDALLAHPDVRAVSFVGSTPIARSVYERAAANGKRVQALGGAKNHMVVLPDADLELAADAAVSAGYGSAGERCMAISVVVAVGTIADPLVDAIRTRSEALTVGPGSEPASEMGPLVTAVHRDRVLGYVDRGVDEGATLVVDGRSLRVSGGDDGFYLGPCLFDHVTADMAIYRDEIFGPVLSVVRVDSYEDAARLVSQNPYANGAAVFTRDGGAARRFEREVDAGMVGVNVPIPVPMAYYSFGGWKQSLFGDTHVHGPEGVHFYTRGKVVTSRWPDPATRGPDLGFPHDSLTDPDAIVIGAGPNGLVAANLLADAGWKVVVLEAAPTPGGAVRSAELAAPGFVADVCSSCYPLGVASPVLQSLGLDAYGLRWANAPLALAHPTPSGCVIVDPSDPDATTRSIDAFAPGDGARWERLYKRWERAGGAVLDALLAPFPPVRQAARAARKVGLRDIVGFTRMSLWSLDRVNRDFEGEGGPLMLGGNMAHTDLSVTSVTGAMYGWLLACLAQDVGFPVVEGGAGRLVDALVARLVAAGGELRTGTRVTRVEVRDGRAIGVETADGTAVRANRAVLADTSAPALYLDLVGEEHLTRRYRRALRRFTWDYSTVKVDWALDAPIPWAAADARRAGVVHLADSVADLRTAGAQLQDGLVPARPFIIVGQTSTADPTRSAPGTEAAWAYTHVPQQVRGDAGGDAGGDITGRWEAGDAERVADRVEDELERRAPGFRSHIQARHILSPVDLEALDANLHGGAIGGGTSALRQQLFLRPVPGVHGGARTPIRSLFLASASAHPGGGVHGACGANAARAALRAHPH